MSADLIKRLEKAEEGSRELDAAIRFALFTDMTRCNFEEGCYHGTCESPGCGEWLGMADERTSYPHHWQDDTRLPPYTTSLDAALMLVPNDSFWRVGHTTLCRAWAGVHRTHPDHSQPGKDEFFWRREYWQPLTTPVLALCIVSLQARAAATVAA